MDSERFKLDSVNRGILHILQQDARNNTTAEIGKKVEVSATTVGKRIREMEQDGVLKGYYPKIDYSQTGLELHVLITGEVPVGKRSGFTESALDVQGVVSVQELLTGVENVLIEAVALEIDSVSRITSEIEDIGIDVQNTQLIGSQRIKPFDHFGTKEANGE